VVVEEEEECRADGPGGGAAPSTPPLDRLVARLELNHVEGEFLASDCLIRLPHPEQASDVLPPSWCPHSAQKPAATRAALAAQYLLAMAPQRRWKGVRLREREEVVEERAGGWWVSIWLRTGGGASARVLL
jgi:hypothetical protein